MATVKSENLSNYHDKITVVLTKDDYQPQIDKALKSYSKNANIPGFRKGMVPVGMVKKMYGQSIFADEVLRIAGTKLEEFLMNEKVEIFARPIPAESQQNLKFDINKPEDYIFEFEIGTKPQFSIPLIESKKTFPLHKVIVSHDMLSEELDKIVYKSGNMTEPETITSEDNVLHLDFAPVNTDGSQIEETTVKSSSLLMKYFVPDIQTQWQGKKVNDFLFIDVKTAFDDKVKDAVFKDLGLTDDSQNTSFKVTLNKLGLVEKAELNKDTFDKVYPNAGIETEEAFKERLSGEIQQYWDSQSRVRLHNEIFEALVHETPLELPSAFLKRWMSIGGETYKSPETVEAEYGSFDHQLRWQLITDKIMKEQEITVKREEMEQATRAEVLNYFGQYGHMMSGDSDWMEPFVKKQLADKKYSEDLYNRIITDKIFYYLEQAVTLKEENISLDDFIKLPPSGHHHHHH